MKSNPNIRNPVTGYKKMYLIFNLLAEEEFVVAYPNFSTLVPTGKT
jgi:hypothetical protein